MPKKERKIDIEYRELSLLSEEEISKRLKQNENVDKEIAGKEEHLQTLEDIEQKEKLEKEIAELKKKSNQLKGYAKNKDKIEKIKEVKGNFEKLMQSNMSKKDTLQSELKIKTTELKEIVKEQEELTKMKTEDMTNDEYNRIFQVEEERKQKDSEVKEIRAQIKKIEQKIANQKATISKCDLVWKNLFYNKEWDEIHLKALNMREYKGRKTDIIKDARKDKEKIQVEERDNTETIFKEEPELVDNQLLDDKFAQKHPWLAKIRNVFRTVKNKVSNRIYGEETQEQVVREDVKEVEKVEPTKTRDAFVEELRKMTETEVRENIAKIEKEKHEVVKEEEMEL